MPYTEIIPTEETLSEPLPAADTTPTAHEKRRGFHMEWRKIGAAFWTIASILSLIVNVILIVLVISLGKQLFTLKSLVTDQVLGGLYENFVQMDQAHIRTNIPINTEVPAKFKLPLKTKTTVVLTENTRINNATIYELNAGGFLFIPSAKTDILLPAGTNLPVELNLSVPVNQKIPVVLNVAVDIPLAETDLHKPFVGLQEVVKPYYTLLDQLPDSWQEVICGTQPSKMCQQLVH